MGYDHAVDRPGRAASNSRRPARARIVTVGDTPARFSVASDTQIAVIIPSQAEPGTVDLAITTQGGTATAPTGYTYT